MGGKAPLPAVTEKWLFEQIILLIFPPIEKKGNLSSKKKKYEEKNEGAHMWATVQSRRKTRLHHRDSYSTLSPGQL